MNLFITTLNEIEPINEDSVIKAWKRIDNLTKPIGSLGSLEEIAAKIAGITGSINYIISKKNIIIMCADNGVVEEGVSNCPQSFTATVTNNFTKGITGVCVLSKFSGSDITVVDVGVNADFKNNKIINRKIAYGTNNMVNGPAMTREQAIQAIEVGIEIVAKLKTDGYDLLGTGEMGIGNTTTSAAIISVLSEIDSDIIVGKGSGLTEKQLDNKRAVVRKAIEVNLPDKNDVIDVLSKVGGFDIAALCGCFLGAAKYKIPIVIDGIISSAAALCAYKLSSLCRDYMFPSHLSSEPGAKYVMNEIGLEPILNLKMRLGEGSGCPMTFHIIEGSLYAMNNMATFEEADLTKDYFVDIR